MDETIGLDPRSVVGHGAAGWAMIACALGAPSHQRRALSAIAALQVYQQSAIRKRIVRSDLRKDAILSTVGPASLFYESA